MKPAGLKARAREKLHEGEKVGIKILIGTPICIIGESPDETSPVPTVAQPDVRYNCHKAC